jgi:hypothetical protein
MMKTMRKEQLAAVGAVDKLDMPGYYFKTNK